ncbi:MAG: permease [Candidatus Micrarchaeota archaeon]|nr:permease [Candidatus Micrarchaeota archaeon]
MLEDFAGWIVFSVLGMNQGDMLAESLNFFIYDTIKVFLLLAAMTFLVGIIRTFVTPDRVRKWLGGRKEGVGNVLAALLGVPTPFCSCSAVPLFIGFVEAGVPLGVTFSFLISAPLVNEVALALLFGLFGWEVALLYAGTGLLIAVFAGILIGRLGLEKEVEGFVYELKAGKINEMRMDWAERVEFAKNQMFSIVRKVGPFIVLGVGFGALIHGFVPVGFLAEIAGKDNPLAVPIAVLIGVPLYSNAAGTIPIVQALMAKGMAMGTALALMMSITALSLPEMVILRKVLKPKLIAIFAGILAVSFVIVGLLFNMVM